MIQAIVKYGDPAMADAIADGLEKGRAACILRAQADGAEEAPMQTETAPRNPVCARIPTKDEIRERFEADKVAVQRMDEVRRRYPITLTGRLESFWALLVVIWWMVRGWWRKEETTNDGTEM